MVFPTHLDTSSRRRGLVRGALCLVVLLTAPDPAAGQTRAEQVRRAVTSLPDSAQLRVIAPGIYVDPGFLVGVGSDSLRLADADVLLTVAFDEVEEMSVRTSKWLRVGLTSAAVTGVFGAAMGFFVGSKECPIDAGSCGRHQVNGSVRWGSRLGLAGAIVGAAVGSRLVSWRVVFP